MKHIKTIDNVGKILLSPKLYEAIVYDWDDKEDIIKILDLESFNKSIAGYCPFCQGASKFVNKHLHNKNPFGFDMQEWSIEEFNLFDKKEKLNKLIDNMYFSVILTCTKKSNHKIVFHFFIDKKKIIKVGQFPRKLTRPVPSSRSSSSDTLTIEELTELAKRHFKKQLEKD